MLWAKQLWLKNRNSLYGAGLLYFIFRGLDGLFNWLGSKFSLGTETIFGYLGGVFGYRISIFTAFIAIIAFVTLRTIFRWFVNRRKPLKIISAKYGFGDNTLDVTQELSSAVVGGTLKTIASNNIAGDPSPGQQKQLIVEYIHNGEAGKRIYSENEVVDLPQKL